MLALAWKNIWRSKRRSLVILSAIALGLWGGLFAAGLMIGFGETYVNSAIDRDLTHLQIHTVAFKEDKLLADILPSADSMASVIRSLPAVEEASPRMIVQAMASSAVSSNMVRLFGIEPGRERRATTIAERVESGVYLDSAERMSALVGSTLAKKLSLKLRSKVVMSFQGMDGSIVYGGFRVAGVYRTESSVFDGSTVFARREDLAALVGSGSIAHEIAVRLTVSDAVDRTVDTLRLLYPGLQVEGWKELAPELRITAESMQYTMNIFLGVILCALLFGIVNTMLMSVLDRVREFGVLMAVGMRRRRLFGLIIVETILLAVTGAVVGMICGSLTVWYFVQAG